MIGERKLRTGKRQWRTLGAECAVESLEGRVLPAVDLIVSAGSMTVSTDPPVGSNLYGVNLQFTVKNLGTTPIEMTGVANDPSDNVKIQVYLSLDGVLDGGDPLAFVGQTFSLIDNGSHLLGQNQTGGLGAGKQFLARETFNFLIFKVDFDNQVTESNENNNTFVFDAQAVTLVGGGGVIFIGPKVTAPIDFTVRVRDLNTVNFVGGNFGVLISDAQPKEKLSMLQSGEGADRLRMTGKKLKLGGTTIGTVTKVIPTASNSFEMSLRVDFTGEVSRNVLQRLMQNLSFRAGAKSTGVRTAKFQVKDNLENLSNTTERAIQVT